MGPLVKFMRGEYGLAKTFWLGYVGAIFVLSVLFMIRLEFFNSGRILYLFGNLWIVLSSIAVIQSSNSHGKRTIWGWLAIVVVVLTTIWALSKMVFMLTFFWLFGIS